MRHSPAPSSAAGLVVAPGDHHEAAEQQQRRVAHVAPDVDAGDRGDDLALVTEEALARDPDRVQVVVDDAEVGIEHPHPQQRQDHVRDQPRQHDDAAHDDRLGEAVHQHGDRQRQDRLDADVDDHVLERDPQRVPEQRVVEHLLVVLSAHPVPAVLQQVEVGEAQVEAAQRRIGVEDHEADEAREQEEPRDDGLAPDCDSARAWPPAAAPRRARAQAPAGLPGPW
jgi:hypothetical protein